MKCTTCGGPVVENGPPQACQGASWQFYRCQGRCRLGGWKPATDENGKGGHGPVFEGVHGRLAPALAVEDHARIRTDGGGDWMSQKDGYVADTASNNRKVVHADPDCDRLASANGIRPVDTTSEPYSGYNECGFCMGDWEPSGSDNSLSEMLASEDFGPENLGLSPVGERGGGHG